MKPKASSKTSLRTQVVPYIGTWIETSYLKTKEYETVVVPYIGTWIETKPDIFIALSEEVVPYIGTWIETQQLYRLWPMDRSYLI